MVIKDAGDPLQSRERLRHRLEICGQLFMVG